MEYVRGLRLILAPWSKRKHPFTQTLIPKGQYNWHPEAAIFANQIQNAPSDRISSHCVILQSSFPPTIPMWEAYSSTTGSAPCLSYWSLELWELLTKSYEMRTLSSLTIRVLEICKDFEYDRRHFIVEKEPSKTFSRFTLF